MDFVILAIAVLVFVVFLLVLGERILLSSILRPKKNKADSFPVFDKKFPNEGRFTVNSSHDIPISFVFIPKNDDGTAPEKIVFLLHGYNSSGQSMRKYVPMFLDRGFSVVIPDSRYCGNSGGDSLGLAYLDAEDTLAVFKWIKDCFGDNIPIGLFGESFGAAQAILLAGSANTVNTSFVISDSSFSELYELLKERVRADYRIKPFPLLTIAVGIINKKYGINIKSVSPLRALSQCGKIPIFFIHGEEDNFILPQMSIDLYNSKATGYKKFFLAEGASHCGAFDLEPDTYKDKVYEFLDKINA